MPLGVKRGTVRLTGNEIEYFSFGSGDRAFVMLPGLSVKSVTASAESIASMYRRFSRDFTVWCFERPKFLFENITIDDLAEYTAQAMLALGLKNACVYGASMGGMTAQLIAIRHPELVDRLLLASTCARLNDTARAVMGRWVECAEAGDVDAFCDSFIDVLYGKEFAQKFGDFIRAAHKNISKEEFKRFVLLGKACASLNAYDFLDRLRCRTLVIGAQNDRVLTAQASVEIAEKLGCGLYLYGSEYGHCVFDEAPDYKDRIYRFFSEQE